MSRILVAGVGNIFRSDDGFGSEVVRRLDPARLPAGTHVEDYGIRSVHLAYELMNGYDVLVLVDTVARQEGAPGSLFVIEPDLATIRADAAANPGAPMDAHDLPPGGVLAMLPDLDAAVERVLVVGCRPETLDDGIGLAPKVAAAVSTAVEMVVDVARREDARHRGLTGELAREEELM